MSVMDVFPTLAGATGVTPGAERKLDGLDMWPAISKSQRIEREGFLHFGSEIPRYGSFNFTAFDETWKLVQWVEQDPLSTTVQHELFRITDDPGEYNNLAQAHPDRVQKMAASIASWRALYPLNGTRARISSPPRLASAARLGHLPTPHGQPSARAHREHGPYQQHPTRARLPLG
jgi:arylsulfatase A-like enzyme